MAVTIAGLKRLSRQFDAMADAMNRPRMQAAVNAAAEIVADEAKANARPISTRVAESIRVVVDKPKRADGVASVIKIGHPTWHLLEFGTQAHVINVKSKRVMTRDGDFFGRTVHHPGAREKPFLRPAFDQKGDEALKVIKSASRKNLRDAVRRA